MSDKILNFLFAFQLFSLIPLFGTMEIAIKTLKEKADQFFATGALLIALIWFFSAITLFHLRDAYYDLKENVCDTYFRCFLTYLNYGMRLGGPFDMPLSLPWGDKLYAGMFIFDWLFFFFVNLILLNIFNGIIVDSFQKYREEQTNIEFEDKNICYICSLTRSDFEMHGYNFSYHKSEEHNLKN